MILHKLILKNFRNYEKVEFDFGGESTLIQGFNGAGKSNILEAIHLISTTKSLRATFDKDLIKHNQEIATIEAITQIDQDATNLFLAIAAKKEDTNLSKKIAKINKVAKALNTFAGTFNSVMFTPTDLDIITGSPSLRRKYLDSIFFQFDANYKKSLKSYEKSLRQRNKVLEMIADNLAGTSELAFWTKKIVEEGAQVQQKRASLLELFSQNLPKYLEQLHGATTTSTGAYKIKYLISPATEETLQDTAEKELYTRTTMVGPHKDDFTIYQEDQDIAKFGSRGQQRTAILACKLCELDFLTEKKSVRPILLLDDIYSELDEPHQKAISAVIGLQQTIITSAAGPQNGQISFKPL